MISIQNLRYSYSGPEVDDTAPAIDNVSIDLEAGRIRAILGESGSGKTTLLMCLGRFLEPQAGKIKIEGRDLADIDEVELRQLVGIVFQDLHLFPHLSVLENLTLAPIRVLERERAAAEREALETLTRFGIGELADRYPNEISGGQAQRAAIARALVLKPSYLLLDEPTSALDVRTSREFGEWLLSLQDETTFILVTHDATFAREIAASGVLMDSGKVAADGSIDEILRELQHGG